jgi:nicotinate-nucleotide adenylyltransferase
MRVGILGGTFDPIHIGHLIIAEESRIRLALDRVLFTPTGQPQLKSEPPIASALHRLNMVRLAVAGNPHFAVSLNEVDRPGPSYTVDTLGELSTELGATTELHFILGMDALQQFHLWRDPERVLELCKLVVVRRPGGQDFEVQELLSRYSQAGNRVVVLSTLLIDISGTDIRHRAAAGLSLRYLVPEAVEQYIREHRLYIASPEGCTPIDTEASAGYPQVEDSRFIGAGKIPPSPLLQRGAKGDFSHDPVDRLLELALELGALKYGDFTLSSGKKSRYYFDGRLLSLNPQGANLIGQVLVPILHLAGVKAVGGPTLGADPIVTAVALTSYQEGDPISAFIVRKEAKAHGTAQSIEGALAPGSRVAIIDDTCTTGASLLQAIAAAEAIGCTVVKVLALLDRGEGGADELRRRGYDFQALMAATPEGKIEVLPHSSI